MANNSDSEDPDNLICIFSLPFSFFSNYIRIFRRYLSPCRSRHARCVRFQQCFPAILRDADGDDAKKALVNLAISPLPPEVAEKEEEEGKKT